MGLDTSHDCWHGAYSAFMRFRLELCKAAGYKLVDDPEDVKLRLSFPTLGPPRQMPAIWYEHEWPDERYMGEWGNEVPEDPLVVLIVHADCDGIIPAKWCLPLAKRLQGLAERMPDEGAGHMPSARKAAVQFAEGLLRAHEAEEDVTFR